MTEIETPETGDATVHWDAEGERLARAFASASLVLTTDDPVVHTAPFTKWLRRQGINPAQVHTIAVYEGEMIVKGYAVDARGLKYVDLDTGQGAEFRTFAVPLTEPREWSRPVWGIVLRLRSWLRSSPRTLVPAPPPSPEQPPSPPYEWLLARREGKS